MRAQRRITVPIAVLVVGGLIAASCGTSDSSGASATAEEDAESAPAGATGDAAPDATADGEPSEEAVELTASWQGVSEDTIKIGFAYIDSEELKSLLGLEVELAPPDIFEVLAVTTNAAGGINGRQLEVHTELFSRSVPPTQTRSVRDSHRTSRSSSSRGR